MNWEQFRLWEVGLDHRRAVQQVRSAVAWAEQVVPTERPEALSMTDWARHRQREAMSDDRLAVHLAPADASAQPALSPGRSVLSARLAAWLVAVMARPVVQVAPDARWPAAHAAERLQAVQEGPDARAEPHAALMLQAASGVAVRLRRHAELAHWPLELRGVHARADRNARGLSRDLRACCLRRPLARSERWRSRRAHRRLAPEMRPSGRGSTQWSSA
jgi:hypothetical protein